MILRGNETARDSGWAKFWEERGRTYPDDDPIAMDGWDYGISQMGIEEADGLREQIAQELKLVSMSRILEVGCGAGMYLGPYSEFVRTAAGCDLSESMLRRARRINNRLMVQVAEANLLPYPSNEFDAVLAYSVFHYFPSYDYALCALKELYRVCRGNGRIWIGDIPDQSVKQQALTHRDQLMKENVPRWKWPDVGPLEQRFYDRHFFIEFCEGVECGYRIEEQRVEGYVQGRYRYNLSINKL